MYKHQHQIESWSTVWCDEHCALFCIATLLHPSSPVQSSQSETCVCLFVCLTNRLVWNTTTITTIITTTITIITAAEQSSNNNINNSYITCQIWRKGGLVLSSLSLSLSICLAFHLYNCTYTLHLYLSTSSVKTTQFHHSFAGSLSDHSPFTIHHSPFTRQTTQLHFNI